MAVLLSPVGGVAAQFFTNAGVPLSGGKIYTYAAGTTTPQATYTTGVGNIQHSNPIVLDAAGRVPTGEIWLTDGFSYKFAMYDANNVLIATYDNIVGINSNFVNYVNQQEIQTATADQTVFTLTTMEYQPGTGNLSVFVDGVNQYGPGAQYAYTETSSTVVTFVSGIHVGASVKFTSTQIQNSGVADASQITYTYPDSNAVEQSVEERLAQYISVKDFGALADGSDETTKVQYALDALPTAGGTVYINPGIKFYLTDLTFPEKSNMQYYAGSDLSAPGSASDIDSGELIFFSANSSYPSDPSGAAVNEWRFTAPFHPGVLIDVRKDVQGQNAHLAPGQNLTDPARASYNIQDEQVSRFDIQYNSYSSGSNFTGTYLKNYRAQIVLNGVGTSNWSVAPSVGNQVYQLDGSDTIAAGFIVSQTTSTTTVVWTQGEFVAGSPLKYGSSPVVTSTANLSSATFTIEAMPWIAQDFVKGCWSVGLPPQTPEESFTVGGRIVSTNTRTAGQYVYKTISEPGYGFISSYETNTRGRWMICESANDFKRVILKDVTATNTIGQIGACNAHTGFTNAALTSGRFNITSFVRNGTGDYTFTFTSPLANNYYSVLITAASPTDYGYVYARTTTTVQVKVVTTGTSTPVDVTGIMNMAIFGGDI